jgi:NADPH:quinone reductase-like Zn-dependent oxidoreductase
VLNAIVVWNTRYIGLASDDGPAEAANVYRVLASLSLDHAVAVFHAGAVAVGIPAAMHMQRGDTVLITAAAGRIGSLLVQLAKRPARPRSLALLEALIK